MCGIFGVFRLDGQAADIGLLSAMASGVPPVTTGVAAGGADALPQTHFLVANTHEERATAVLRILEARNERNRLAVAGRSRMLSPHDWGRSMRRLDKIIDRCLAEFGGHAARAVDTAKYFARKISR